MLGGARSLLLAIYLAVFGTLLTLGYVTQSVHSTSSFVAQAIVFLHQLRPLFTLCTIVLAILLAVALARRGRVSMKTGEMLGLCAASAALLVMISVFTSGQLAIWSVLLIGFFNSIMFPSIFTSGIAELGPLTGDGSGLLNMAIVGGAIIPWVVGRIGDAINHKYYPAMTQGETSWGQGIHYALILTALCYLYILYYAVSGSKPNSERYSKTEARS